MVNLAFCLLHRSVTGSSAWAGGAPTLMLPGASSANLSSEKASGGGENGWSLGSWGRQWKGHRNPELFILATPNKEVDLEH